MNDLWWMFWNPGASGLVGGLISGVVIGAVLLGMKMTIWHIVNRKR